MITKIHKNGERSVKVPLEYIELAKCTLEEAQNILEDTNKVIVGLTRGVDFVIFFKGRLGSISGMGTYGYMQMLGNITNRIGSQGSQSYLNLLSTELLESMVHNSRTQVATRSGWLRFFTNPSIVGCQSYRVYDVSQGSVFGEGLSLPIVSR